jgi:lipopolysaccharide exporter
MTASPQTRALQGASYTAIATVITSVAGFIRAIVLARLLSPNDFGVMTFTLFFINLVGSLTPFSLSHAVIQANLDNEEEAASTQFAVDMLLGLGRTILAMLLVPVLGWLFPSYTAMPLIMLVLYVAFFFGGAFTTPMTLLRRRLAYRRIALISILTSVGITVGAILSAWAGWGVWALVAEQCLSRIIMFGGYFFYKPVWRLQWHIDRSFIRRYMRFSFALSTSDLLGLIVDRFDDFWTGAALGQTPLGFYSKAYEIAGYPRRVITEPIGDVAFPLFARLKDNPTELSQAFTRIFGFLVRTGFLITLVLCLATPEFIEITIGPKWLPVASIFRLMVVYLLLDPLRGIIGTLFIALGQPAVHVKALGLQAVLFVPAVIGLANLYSIYGVAVAADVMMSVGFAYVLWQACHHPRVSFSLKALFLAPGLAALLSAGAVLGMDYLFFSSWPVWLRFLAKVSLTTAVYGLAAIGMEYKLYFSYAKQALEYAYSQWGAAMPNFDKRFINDKT